MAPLALAVLTVTAGLLVWEQLTILHLIGMLLIVAVGSNYALFFDRAESRRAARILPLTLASLLIANTATVLGFGVLAFSTCRCCPLWARRSLPGHFSHCCSRRCWRRTCRLRTA